MKGTSWRAASGALMVAGIALMTNLAAGHVCQFTALPLSVKQAGMGDTSAGAGDVLTMWSNPAWLGLQKGRVEGGITGGGIYGFDETALGIGAGYRRSWYRIGLVAFRYSASFPQVDGLGFETGKSVENSGQALGGALAARWSWFGMGLGIKSYSETIGGILSVATYGVDIGFAAFKGPFRAGLSTIGRGGQTGPAMVDRASLAYLYEPWQVTFAAEAKLTESGPGRYLRGFGLGGEWQAAPYLAIRGGVTGLGNQVQATFGLSGRFRQFTLDYAFGTHPVGVANRVSLGYSMPLASSGGGEVMTSEGSSRLLGEKSPASTVTADSLYQESAALYASGNYTGSWRKAADALALDPRHWQSWQMIGNCQYALGDKAGAIVSYRRSLELNPDNPALKAWLDQTPP